MPSPTAHETAIADIIARLLVHYATADEPLDVRRSIAADWLEDLSEFTVAQVQWAAKEWRRCYASRPTIAEIRKLAIEAQRQGRDQAALENKNREQDGGTWEPWLHDLWGPASTGRLARQDAIAAQNARYARAEQWRRENPHWAVPKPLTARDLGVTATSAPRPPFASYPDEPS